MQEEFAATGKFTVVLSYAQKVDDEEGIETFLNKRAKGIPVYDEIDPPGAPCGRGIPDAYLFDHTGAIVKHGHPMLLYDLVEELVEAAPDPVPPPLLGSLEPLHFEKEAQVLADPTQPVLETLRAIEAAAEETGPRSEEARQIVAQVHAWLPEEVDRIEKRSRRRPGTSTYRAQRFLVRFEGVDSALEERVAAFEKEMLREPGIKDFLRGMADLDRASAAEGTKATQYERRAAKVLKRVADNEKASEYLRKEASAKLAGLG